MSDVFDLTCELIGRASVTPDDAGCQDLIAARLECAGFRCERLRFGEVDMILPPLLGHPDKRFNIANRGERDDEEEGGDEAGAQAV